MHQTLSYNLTVFYRNFSTYTAKRLQELGLHYGALFFVIYVGKHPGCTQAELTNALHVDWGYSQRSIEKLVQDGFMTKERIEGGGRTHRLNLTDQGNQAFQISHQVFFDWDTEKLAVLREEEQIQLFNLLKKVMEQEDNRPCMKP